MPVFVAIAFTLLIAVFILMGALRRADFQVSRSAHMAAPPAAVFPHVNEMKKWEGWNPWGKIDPNMTMTYSGPPAGVGASYAWVGNNQVGAGKNTITESRPDEHIRFKLEFYKPMAGICDTVFTFKPESGGTAVTWTMSGRHNFMARIMCTFMNMDKMIGGQFEKGLATLKSIAEGRA